MKRYLITGGCGFLGSNIAAALVGRGHDVIVFDNLSRHGSMVNLNWLRSQGAVRFVHGDIRNPSEVLQVVKDSAAEVVFHLAGQVAMTASISNPRLDFEINALGSLNVLEAVRQVSPQTAIVYSSTNKVYGDLDSLVCKEVDQRYMLPEHPYGIAEDSPLDFHSPYGCSKGAADQYMLDYARIFKMNTVVFRHSSMYGGRQFATYDQGWIGWFCAQMMYQAADATAPAFTISGNGKQVRDVLHAEDMIELYVRAGDDIGHIRGRAFNIGGGMANSLSILELLDFLGAELGIQARIEQLPVRESDQRVFVADLRRIQSLLGWSPRIGWQEGLRKMLVWVKSYGHS